MCTVTFMPKSNDGFILTSNRDEAPGRETYLPTIYEEDGVKLLYPQDAVAGGTWIGVSEKKRLVCLMNGGFVAHERKSYYRKSRGVVVKDLLKCNNLQTTVEAYDYTDIEPFTTVLVEWGEAVQLFQLVWDGTKFHFSEKPLAPQIWSSSPLYSEELKHKREAWFSEFLMQTINPSDEEILQFHKTAGDGDITTSLVMNRNFVKTKSITQVLKIEGEASMRYEDLQSGVLSKAVFSN